VRQDKAPSTSTINPALAWVRLACGAMIKVGTTMTLQPGLDGMATPKVAWQVGVGTIRSSSSFRNVAKATRKPPGDEMILTGHACLK